MADPNADLRQRLEKFENWYARSGFAAHYCAQSAYEQGWKDAQPSQADLEAARREERKRNEALIVAQIESSTGPTGGWLDSPKAICAAIVAALKGE